MISVVFPLPSLSLIFFIVCVCLFLCTLGLIISSYYFIDLLGFKLFIASFFLFVFSNLSQFLLLMHFLFFFFFFDL